MQLFSKLALYHCLRSQGMRLYSCRSWYKATCTSTTLLQSSTVPPVVNCLQKNNVSSIPKGSNDVGFFNRIKEKIGFKGGLQYHQPLLKATGFRLYLSAAEAVLYNDLFENMKLPDSYRSWRKIANLHCWLIMVRLQSEGREGVIVRNSMITNLNVDAQAQAKKVGKAVEVTVKSKSHRDLHGEFVASLLSYDEGLMSSDVILAASIWRSLFDFDQNIDPIVLENMVMYIRKQIHHLDSLNSKIMLSNGLIPFLPVHGNSVPQHTYDALEGVKQKLIEYYE